MPALFKNNASALLAASITNTDTTIVVSAGIGNSFPAPSGTSYFYGTLFDSVGNYEIVKCTARTTDTLTIVRAQDGTNALAFTAGDGFALRPIAAVMNNFAQLDGANTFTGTGNSYTVGANFKIVQAGSNLAFQYNGSTIATISSTGAITAAP